VKRPDFASLGTNARLALLAAALGLVALVVGDPASSSRVTLDTRELAAIVEGEVDHVTPDTLAGWIVDGRQDYRLLDLRPEADYAAYHLPGAERLAITDLDTADLPRNEKYVLYSEEGIHSAQAWMLLKARRYPAVYILLGGLDQWREQVLFPLQPNEGATPAELAAFERSAARARHFGGAPRAAASVSAAVQLAAAPTLPSVAPPAASPVTAKTKKKKEGC
jgi:rhodanese-related sulfurtransferase